MNVFSLTLLVVFCLPTLYIIEVHTKAFSNEVPPQDLVESVTVGVPEKNDSSRLPDDLALKTPVTVPQDEDLEDSEVPKEFDIFVVGETDAWELSFEILSGQCIDRSQAVEKVNSKTTSETSTETLPLVLRSGLIIGRPVSPVLTEPSSTDPSTLDHLTPTSQETSTDSENHTETTDSGETSSDDQTDTSDSTDQESSTASEDQTEAGNPLADLTSIGYDDEAESSDSVDQITPISAEANGSQDPSSATVAPA